MTAAELKIKEQEEDIKELMTFLSQATRDNVKKSLQTTLNLLQEEVTRLQKSEKQRLERQANQTAFSKKIDAYGWDQSEKFVKIYITSLKDLNKVQESDVVSNFNEKSFDLVVKNLNNVNYNLALSNLCFKIVPEDSLVKLKKDMIAVWLKKKDVGKDWPGITEKELKDHEKKMDSVPKMDSNADPQEGLMSLMKKMYDEGDDEMKRTISKSFMESREKSSRGVEDGLGGLGGMGGMSGMPGMGGMGGMPGMGGMGGMPGMGGMGGMPGMPGMGGMGGMPDMESMMNMMGGLGKAGGL